METLSAFFGPPEVGDARIFLAGVIDLMSRYPAEVVDRSLDVSMGLPGKYKWWPKVSEIKEILDELHGPYKFATSWEIIGRKQLEERERLAIADQRPKKTMEQHAAELAERGIFILGTKNNATAATAEQIREKHGISQAQWDAIPNSKSGT